MIATLRLIRAEPALLLLLPWMYAGEIVTTLGRILRSWCASLGMTFLMFGMLYLIGAPEMPDRILLALVLSLGTVFTLHMHTLFGR